jgi:hypothetical protein
VTNILREKVVEMVFWDYGRGDGKRNIHNKRKRCLCGFHSIGDKNVMRKRRKRTEIRRFRIKMKELGCILFGN